MKVTVAAAGAALIGLAAGLPVAVQLLLVASTPLLAGVVSTAMLVRHPLRAGGPVSRR